LLVLFWAWVGMEPLGSENFDYIFGSWEAKRHQKQYGLMGMWSQHPFSSYTN
jgi:hypothetical protein